MRNRSARSKAARHRTAIETLMAAYASIVEERRATLPLTTARTR